MPMDLKKLDDHILHYRDFIAKEGPAYRVEYKERQERKSYFRSWNPDRLRRLSSEEFTEILSRLWAMLIWGNKKYVSEKLLQENGLPKIREALERLIWGSEAVAKRWDWFRANIKGM